MKKAVFIVSPFFGGASRMTLNTASLLDPKEYEILYLVSGPKAKEIKYFLPPNAKVECLNIRNIWDFATFKLYRIFKRFGADIVFSSFTHINVRVAIAGKLAKAKVILRSSSVLSGFSKINQHLIKFTYPLADVIVTQNEEMREELQAFVPKAKEKIIFLHNIIAKATIDENLKEGNPYTNDDEIRYVWPARISEEKGHDVLLKAFRIVREKIQNAHLYLLGKYDKDAFYEKLTSYIKDNELSEYVHFEGLLKNPHVWIKYANCLVLPSRREGLPNVLLESMYIGTPVVSTRCVPIITRIVDEGQNGYTVEEGNAEEMADAMLKAIQLTDCKLTYASSTEDEFRKLFK